MQIGIKYDGFVFFDAIRYGAIALLARGVPIHVNMFQHVSTHLNPC